jgi:hypothetical protein
VPVYNPEFVNWWREIFHPSEAPMSGTKAEDYASRTATYLVFIFLIAAIVETLIANFGR